MRPNFLCIVVVGWLVLSGIIPEQSVAEDVSWTSVKLASGKIARLGDPDTITQTQGASDGECQVNLALILDASGSMKAKLPGAKATKLDIAKQVLAEFIPQIPNKVMGSLWIYGHRYPQKPKERSCQDIQRVYPLQPIDSDAYVNKIERIHAIGYTPIADSLRKAAKDLPSGDHYVNAILLVSDGEETCGGDPCALAKALKASDASVTIHVVGYDVDENTRKQLECIAQASGGGYHDANDAQGLLKALEEAMGATVSQTLLRVELVGPRGEKASGNIDLYQAGGEQHRKMGTFVAWKDNMISPGQYNLMIDSLPSILYQDLNIEKGSTTVVRIPLGSLSVKTPKEQGSKFDLFDDRTGIPLGYYNETVFVAPGSFRVAVNNSHGDPVLVQPGEAKVVVLGAIRATDAAGKSYRVNVYDRDGSRLGNYGEDVLLVPGTYRVGIHQSLSKDIRVDEGAVTEVRLCSIKVIGIEGKAVAADIHVAGGKRLGVWGGDIQLVPGDYRVGINGSISDPIRLDEGSAVSFYLGAIQLKEGMVFDARGRRLGYYKNTLLLVPGTYTVKTGKKTLENIKVEANKVTPVQ